jgi:hypothetical protein
MSFASSLQLISKINVRYVYVVCSTWGVGMAVPKRSCPFEYLAGGGTWATSLNLLRNLESYCARSLHAARLDHDQ